MGKNFMSYGDAETVLTSYSNDIKSRAKQVSTMPAASASLAGKIYQYTGATTANYTHGYFYECIENSGAYEWQNVPLGSGNLPDINNISPDSSSYPSSIWTPTSNGNANTYLGGNGGNNAPTFISPDSTPTSGSNKLVTSGGIYTARQNDLANIAPVENGTTATRAYAVGDYVMWQNVLYRVTVAISVGTTFTVGTNIVQTSVGREIKDDIFKKLIGAHEALLITLTDMSASETRSFSIWPNQYVMIVQNMTGMSDEVNFMNVSATGNNGSTVTLLYDSGLSKHSYYRDNNGMVYFRQRTLIYQASDSSIPTRNAAAGATFTLTYRSYYWGGGYIATYVK